MDNWFFNLRFRILQIWHRLFKSKSIKHRHSNKPRMTFDSGPLYYFGNLLEGMDDYIAALKQLRKYHPDTYDYYSKVGAPIFSSKKLFDKTDLGLSARWRNDINRPSIAICHLHGLDTKEKIYPVFITILKLRAKEGVQFTNADMYEGFIIFKRQETGKIEIAASFYFSVSEGGEVSILRVVRQSDTKPPLSKKTRTLAASIKGTRKAKGSPPTQRWGVPTVLKEFAIEHSTSPTRICEVFFATAALAADRADQGLLVRARKDGVCAAFSIDLLRTPYFFKDRIKIKTPSGRTKPIFHIVRTHPRKNSKFVNTHFRGLRRFNWLGYRVTVSMPGFHHRAQTEFTAETMMSDDPMLVDKKGVDMEEAGRRISNALDT